MVPAVSWSYLAVNIVGQLCAVLVLQVLRELLGLKPGQQ